MGSAPPTLPPVARTVRAALTAVAACSVAVACPWACGRPAPSAHSPCYAPPPADGTVFARVGDAAITDRQLQAYEGLGQLGGEARTLQAVMGKLEDRVRFELLAHAAADRGLATDPEVVEAARKAMVRKLLADEMGTQKLGAKLQDDELCRYYAQHRQDYQQPELRRFALLAFGNDALGRAQAEAFAARWRNEADDARSLSAALRVSLPVGGKKTRRRPRAPLRWQEQAFASQATVARLHGEDVAAAAFAGPPWAMPPFVETVRGPVAVRVLARRQAMVRSFAEARADIVEQLVRRRRAAAFGRYLDEIRATYPMAIYEDRVRAWLREASDRPAATVQSAAPAPVTAAAAPPPPGNASEAGAPAGTGSGTDAGADADPFASRGAAAAELPAVPVGAEGASQPGVDAAAAAAPPREEGDHAP